jgi:hippurate hydrolase
MPDPVLSRFLDDAKDLLPSAVLLRRRIHENPELGLDLPLTTQAVLDGLQGLDVDIARGTSTSGLIVSLTGTKPGSQSGRTILLRGDMDALPMPEETGLEFASKIPGRMHACGHDSTRPCWSLRCSSCTAIATSCRGPSNLCSSPARRGTLALGA